MTTRETWYVLEDGSFGDPREVAPDDKGVLRHKNGAAVAVGPHGPKSSGVDVEAERAKAVAAAEEAEKLAAAQRSKTGGKSKDMKAGEQKPPYMTRETKAN
jgi:hypothetical protein